MALQTRHFLDGAHRGAPASTRRVAASAAKASKGFGKVQKQNEENPSGNARPKKEGASDKQVVREAAAAVASREKYRPVQPGEAAKGKLDYVQVADWGDGDRSKLGNLRMVSHTQQYAGGDGRPFHTQLAHQLQLAESRGALAVAGPPPPPLYQWSFREGRYEQYLVDQLEVHKALEAALQEAIAGTAPAVPAADLAPEAQGGESSTTTTTTTTGAGASSETAPQQCALHALRQLAPGRLGLERSEALQRDLAALRASYDHPAAAAARAAAAEAAAGPVAEAEAAAETSGAGPEPQAEVTAAVGAGPGAEGGGGGGGERPATTQGGCSSGPMARSYAQVLRRLGRVAATGASEQERQTSGLRLLAHAAVLHMVGQAVWVRVGAAATERLALLQRRAAATYHEYPEEVSDPRVTLSRALDAAGEHLRGPAPRQVVFEEMAGAMQKTGLLMTALAHRD